MTKKFFIYKSYMQNSDSLYNCIKNLKKHLETQGIAYRNVKKCRKALRRFKEVSSKQKENTSEDYKSAVKKIQEYLEYFMEYYDILVELNLEPKTNMRNDSFFKENGKVDQSQNLDLSGNILNGHSNTDRDKTKSLTISKVEPMIKSSKNGVSYRKKTSVYGRSSKFNL